MGFQPTGPGSGHLHQRFDQPRVSRGAGLLPSRADRKRASRGAGLLPIAVFVLAGLAWTTMVDAAGMFLPVQGVRATGRGGAVTVSGAGPYAIWHNPAGLMDLDGLHLYGDLVLATFGSSFLRAPQEEPYGDLTVFPEVNNEKGPDLLPSLIAVWDLGLEDINVGLGMYPPMGYRYSYPLDGPQRYTAVGNGSTLLLMVELAVAARVTSWLEVGAGFQSLYFDSVTYTVASAWPGVVGYPEDAEWDALLKIRATDRFAPSGNLGLRAQVIDGLQVALAVQLPVHIEDQEAEIQMRLPDHPLFDSVEVSGERVSTDMDFPTSVRAGVRYQHPLGDVELDLVWQDWSIYDAIRFQPQGIVIVGLPQVDEFTVRPVEMVMDWHDSFSLHLGGDVAIPGDLFTVRGGVLYEPSAIPDERLSVFQMDLTKIAPTIGVTLNLERQHLAIDLAYTHLFLLSRQIENSAVTQNNATYEEGAVVVGNGDYSGSFDLFGLGVEARF